MKKPPPFVPSCLMAICEAAGPEASTWEVTALPSASFDRLEQRHRVGRGERLHHALRDEDEGDHERQRQQDVERAAREIDPEVADRGARAPRETADQRDQHRHAGRRRHEVLHGEAEHLRQVAQRRFAAVALPVRVRREARRGIERRVGRDGRQALRIERQRPCTRCSTYTTKRPATLKTSIASA